MTFMKEEDADVTTKALLTIIQGRDLSKPKEKKVLGSKSLASVIKKCNPYVEISAYGHHVGYTPHISGTLNPDWSSKMDDDGVIMQGDNVFKMTLWGDHQHKVTMKIWHHSEKGDDPKRMGTAMLMVPPKPGDVTGWIDVEKERSTAAKSDNNNNNTTTTRGQLRVRLQTVVIGKSDTKNSLKKNTMTKSKSSKETLDGQKIKKKKKKKKKTTANSNNEQQITSPKSSSSNKKKMVSKKKKNKKEKEKEKEKEKKDVNNDSDEGEELPALYESFTDLTSLYEEEEELPASYESFTDLTSLYKEEDLDLNPPSSPTDSRMMLSFSDLQKQHSQNMAMLSFGDLLQQEEDDLPPLKIHKSRSDVYLKLFQTEDDILSSTKILKLNQRIKFIKEDLELAEQQYTAYRKQEDDYNNSNSNNSNVVLDTTNHNKERRRSSCMSIDPLEDIVEFLREENEILLREVEEIISQKPSDENENNSFSTSKTRVRLTIIRGQNLVAMNEDETSDPFVEIYIFNQLIKQTDTKYQTLSPVWNEQFEMTLTRELKSDFPPITLKIVDEDYDDMSNSKMGQIDIPIPKNLQSDLEYESDKTRWYRIPANSAVTKDVYATGELQIKLELEPLVCHNFQVKQLESEVERLQKQLDRLNALNQAAADAENKRQNTSWLDNIISSSSLLENDDDENESPLSATKEYLQQNNRELAKQLYYLRQM